MSLITFRAWNLPLLRPDCNHFVEFLKRQDHRVPPLNSIGQFGLPRPAAAFELSSQPAVDNRFDVADCQRVDEVLCPPWFSLILTGLGGLGLVLRQQSSDIVHAFCRNRNCAARPRQKACGPQNECIV